MTAPNAQVLSALAKKSHNSMEEAVKASSTIDHKVFSTLKEIEDEEFAKLAKYKLEVVFMKPRSRQDPFLGVICAWKNGGSIYGGGDEVIYFCSGKTEDQFGHLVDCNNPLDMKFVGGQAAVCPRCRTAVDPKTLCGQIIAKSTFQNWAKLITHVFHLLGNNADVRMGFMERRLSSVAAQEQAKQMHGEALTAMRKERHWVDYSLQAVIRDTINGADVEKRFHSFLEA